jgi:hypothetical protein
MFSMTTQLKINYKDYLEFMFAAISAFLPVDQGHDLRRVAGHVFFRSTDHYGSTYRNGLIHSYDDQHSMINSCVQLWFRDGVMHRDGDLPAYVDGDTDTQRWYKNGLLHRECGPAVIEDYGLQGIYQEWWLEGLRHRVGGPAFINNHRSEWWENGLFIRQDLVR